MSWNLQGTYFETCNCEVVCPCNFLGAPTEGECTALVAWHIDHGADGEASLDGLNVAIAVHSPGPMTETKWRVALYLDERASDQQKQALTRIFAGQAGGHPAVLASFVGDVLGVATARIDYQAAGRRRSVSIAGIGATEIEAIEGQAGGEVTVDKHPFSIAPGEVHTVARSKRLNYADHGMNWTISDKHGFYAPFAYQGP
jgi:hypothetical protein